MLWPESEPEAGRASLRQALSSLRRQLTPPGAPRGAVILAGRVTVRLNPEICATDVADMSTALAAAARAASASDRAALLEQAVEHYRGELLPGFDEDWIPPERARLRTAFLGAVHDLVGHLERTRDLRRALPLARRAVAADPLREEAHCDLMRVLAAAGEPAEALRQFRELERILAREIGVSPDARTRALAREIEGRPPVAIRAAAEMAPAARADALREPRANEACEPLLPARGCREPRGAHRDSARRVAPEDLMTDYAKARDISAHGAIIPCWVEPDPTREVAIDALGLSWQADQLAEELLPDLSVLTRRARYLSFLSWAVSKTSAAANPEREIHRLEATLALYEAKLHDGDRTPGLSTVTANGMPKGQAQPACRVESHDMEPWPDMVYGRMPSA